MQTTLVEEIEQRNMAVVRETHAALARGDLEAFKSHLAPDYVRHCQAMPPEFQEIRGTEKFLAFLEDFIAGAVNIVIQRLEDGKVAETWVSWDNVAMLSQLGLFPPAPTLEVG